MRSIVGAALLVSGGVLFLAAAVLTVGIGLGQSRLIRAAGPVGRVVAGGAPPEIRQQAAAARRAEQAPARGRHAAPG
jgi:hypothetical protein